MVYSLWSSDILCIKIYGELANVQLLLARNFHRNAPAFLSIFQLGKVTFSEAGKTERRFFHVGHESSLSRIGEFSFLRTLYILFYMFYFFALYYYNR